MDREPFLYIGPMSTQTIEAVLTMPHVGLLPSQNQVDWDGGYTGYTTEKLADVVYSWRPDLYIERDHFGAKGFSGEQFKADAEYMSIIHIDPWRKAESLDDGIDQTINMLRIFFDLNSRLFFEIGTEQAVWEFSLEDMTKFINRVHKELSIDIYSRILYFVTQSGVSLDLINCKNNAEKIREDYKNQNEYVHSMGMKTKEHNGDYLSGPDIGARRMRGLDAINLAPEFGQMESKIIYASLRAPERKKFAKICRDYKDRWVKWTGGQKLSQEQTCLVGGHYVFNTPEFEIFEYKYKINVREQVRSAAMKRMAELCSHINKI